MTAIVRTVRLTGAESFWYVLGCIAFGAMYFAKIPAKKALSEVGLGEMTGAEQFWYVLQCIAFGAGYFAKVPMKKALSDLTSAPATPYDPRLGYGTDSGPLRGYGQDELANGQPGRSPALPASRRHARHDGRIQQGW